MHGIGNRKLRDRSRCARRASTGARSTTPSRTRSRACRSQTWRHPRFRFCVHRKSSHGNAYRAVQAGRRRDRGPLQVRLRHRHRIRARAAGAQRRHRPVHLRKEERTGLDAGMAARGLSAVEEDGGAALGARPSHADRLPGRVLLRRAQEEGRAQDPGRGRSQAARNLRQARYPAARARGTRRRRGRCRVRFRFRRDDVQGDAGEGRCHLLRDLGSDSRTIRS